MKHEHRFLDSAMAAIGCETRAEGGSMIVGYAAVFYDGTPATEYRTPWFRERIAAGAFDEALKQDDVRALFNHNSDLLLGRMASDTLRLTADKRGLRYEIDAPDTQVGRDVLVSIKRKDITGSSFGFSVIDEDLQREKDGDDTVLVRVIKNVELYDVSPVTFPAYDATEAEVRAETRERVKRMLVETIGRPAMIEAGMRAARIGIIDAEIAERSAEKC